VRSCAIRCKRSERSGDRRERSPERGPPPARQAPSRGAQRFRPIDGRRGLGKKRENRIREARRCETRPLALDLQNETPRCARGAKPRCAAVSVDLRAQRSGQKGENRFWEIRLCETRRLSRGQGPTLCGRGTCRRPSRRHARSVRFVELKPLRLAARHLGAHRAAAFVPWPTLRPG
jgi:hypothetical protein